FAHRAEEDIRPAAQLHGRGAIGEEIADRLPLNGKPGGETAPRMIEEIGIAAARLADDRIGEIVDLQRTIVARDGDGPGRKGLAQRQVELRMAALTVERDQPGAMNRLSVADNERWGGDGIDLGCRTQQIVDLRERMNRLLEQQIARAVEHPVAELAA